IINMLDGEIDTDIKTVADRDLPKPGDPEKISVRILSNKKPDTEKAKPEKPAAEKSEKPAKTEDAKTETPKIEKHPLGETHKLEHHKTKEEPKHARAVDERAPRKHTLSLKPLKRDRKEKAADEKHPNNKKTKKES
ncbi:hypothetical protein IJ847_01555, partial [Candidatus Saccharibacteria bacterium]|nr:hypothetical protein [Candidatus Saccharibacteria bacterium]